MIRLIITLLLICFLPRLSFAQLIIKGVIVDSVYTPIQRAIIQIRNAKANTLLKTCLSNNRGKFEFQSNLDSLCELKITVSHISYKKIDTQVVLKSWTIKDLIIVMKNGTHTSLQEVIVKSSPVYNKDDTTTYRVKAFVDGTEKTLEDVAKKMPGLVVNDDGSMTFKGKRLSRILIEGEDLLSNKTKLLSKNFPADLLENIQLIDNYNDNQILKGFYQGDQTIMNLKLNKRKLKVAFGEIGLSGGASKRKDFNITIFSLLNKLKSATIANHNNIGNDNIQIAGISVDSDDAQQKISNFNYQNIVNLPQNIINPYTASLPLPSNRWFFNNQTNVTHQSNFNIRPKIKTKLSTNFQTDNSSINYNRQATYFQGALNINVFDTNATKFTPLKLKLNWQNEISISTNQQMRILLQYDINNNRYINNQKNEQLNIKSINNGELINNIKSSFVLIDYTNRLKENSILIINSYYTAKNIKQNYILLSDNFGRSLYGTQKFNQAIQEISLKEKTVGSQFQLLRKKNRTVNNYYLDILGTINYRDNFLTLQSQIQADSIFQSSIQNDKNNIVKLRMGFKNIQNFGTNKFTNLIEAGYLNWENLANKKTIVKNGAIGTIESAFDKKLNKQLSGRISGTIERLYNDNHLLNDSVILISNTELMRYFINNEFNTKVSLNLNLFYISNKLLFLTLNGGYFNQTNSFVATNNFSNSLNFINNKFTSNSTGSQFLTFQSKSPLLKLKSRVELMVNVLNQSIPYNERVDIYSRFYLTSINSEFKFITVFKSKLNGEVGLKYINSKNVRKLNEIELSRFKNISLINFGKLFYRYLKNNTISIFHNNFNLNINNRPLRFNFIDFEVNYFDEKNSLQMEVAVKNILNQTIYNQFTQNPLFQSNTNYLMFGRSIDFRIKLKF